MQDRRLSHRLALTLGSLALLVPATAGQLLRYTKWETYAVSDGMPANKVLSVAVDDERVWAGTENGLVLIEAGRIRKVFGIENGLAGRAVTAIAVDRKTGSLWIATFGGLSRYSGGQFQNYTSLASGLANDIVYDVDVQGKFVWAATAAGISRLNTHTGEWSIFSEESAPLGGAQAVVVAGGESGMYFGIWGGGAVEYNGVSKRWRNLVVGLNEPPSGTDGQRGRFVNGIAYSASTRTLWTATPLGISAFDGRKWRDYGAVSGSGGPDVKINAIRSLGAGLWICTDRGLTFFDHDAGVWITYRSDAAKGGRGVVTSRGPDNILNEQETPTSLAHNNVFSVAFQKSDIWVATAGGLSHGMAGDVPAGTGDALKDGNPLPGRGRSLPHAQPDMIESASVNIGFFGPLENSPESVYGISMLHGAQLAIEKSNARGGYRSGRERGARPYALKVHNDSAQWGASTMELAKMAFDNHVVAALGPIDGVSAQVMLRASSLLEIPIVETGATDPAISETGIPWLLRNFPDDRRQAAALADYVFSQMRLRRVGVVSSTSRAARTAAQSFVQEAQRVGIKPVVKVDFGSGTKDLAAKVEALREARIDGFAIFAEPTEAAALLKYARAHGLMLPAFGTNRLACVGLVASAGPAAEGLVAASVLHPVRGDSRWASFDKAYRLRFDVAPDSYASYAYDGTMILIEAIEKSSLSRAAIMEQLRSLRTKTYSGVSGDLHFDSNLNNDSPVSMTRVEGGQMK